MVSPADILATLGCVWAAAATSSPAPRTAHIDLWWQPAPSLDDARSACAATTRCTGVWWNERDSVYRRLSGAVAAVDARGAHADAYSVHTNACDVATFREALAASGADVAFVVTTVPRKGRGRYKGKTYFAAHWTPRWRRRRRFPSSTCRGTTRRATRRRGSSARRTAWATATAEARRVTFGRSCTSGRRRGPRRSGGRL